MNGMLATYESTLIESYGHVTTNNKNNRKHQHQSIPESPRHRINEDHYKIFDAIENADMREEMESL